MDRSNRERDNISHGGRSNHTYTPRSHEDLLKSHLCIDDSRRAKLQNDLHILAAENDRLKKELGSAYQDLQNKEDKINDLLSKLSNRPRTPPSVIVKEDQFNDPGQIFETDGKPVSIQYLINHFNVVIQRHHDLLNLKNKQIQDLLGAQNIQLNQRGSDRRHITTQSSSCSQPHLNDFTNEFAQVRKEYEHVVSILSERNVTLEKLIETLHKNISVNSIEINNLRNQLEKRDTSQPSENTLHLIQDLEKENKRLKETITKYQNQNQNSTYKESESPVINTDEENLIKKLIQERQDAINKLNHMINGLKLEQPASGGTDSQSTTGAKSNHPHFEKECQDVISDLNKVNDKLNTLLNKMKDPSLSKGMTNKDDLILNLENLKKQCQDELERLKNRDDKNNLYSSQHSRSPYDSERPLNQLSSPQRSYKQPYPEPSKNYPYYPVVPCEACSAASFPIKTPTQRSVTPPQKSKEDITRPKPKINEFYAPSERAWSKERKRGKSKGKGGCCGKKGSDTSDYPYSKNPEEEKLVNVHNPYINQEKEMNSNVNSKGNTDVHTHNFSKSHRHNKQFHVRKTF